MAGHQHAITPEAPPAPTERAAAPDHAVPDRPFWLSLVKLARPTQWSKSIFVLVGPFYGLRDLLDAGRAITDLTPLLVSVLATALAFALGSSGCYVFNDLADRIADRAHPRKRRRPIACGQVSPHAARIYGTILFVAAGLMLMPVVPQARIWVALSLGLYIANVMLYSAALKHIVIADVMSLSVGFVLRVMGGCAAAMIEPSVWLLNVVFFLSMFLAFGKRLGERRTLGPGRSGDPGDLIDGPGLAVAHRRVHAGYTDTLLQMAVVVTAVITLMTYALYVSDQSHRYVAGFNLLWLTILPATYGMFRAIVLIERGVYDDPTELAVHDRPFQVSGLVFVALTVGLMLTFRP